MKAVIFGAGASFDSIYEFYDPPNPFNDAIDRPSYEALENYYSLANNQPWRPPLAKQLFSARNEFKNILNKYPGALSLSHEAHERSDIEVFLDEVKTSIERSLNYELFAKFINTQYYLQDLLGQISENYAEVGKSNYHVIANHAHNYSKYTHEDVIFITFNYDLLLEKAVEQTLNKKFTHIDDYISSHLKIFKPHGSCNWHLPIGNLNEKEYVSAPQFFYENIHLYSRLFPYENQQIVLRRFSDHSYFDNAQKQAKIFLPQIALPLTSKTEFLLPQNHMYKLRESLPKVDEVLVVGWRATERHFLNLLKDLLGNREIQVKYVCCDNNETIKNIEKYFEHRYSKFEKSFHKNTKTDSSYIIHPNGTFSSYIRNVTAKREENFFAF